MCYIMAFGVMGCRGYGLSKLWVVGVMGRRNRDLTPLKSTVIVGMVFGNI